jgi:hypothetical protein
MEGPAVKVQNFWILLLFSAVISCDGGLAPPERAEGPPYLTGLITYRNWPPADSIVDLRLVLFVNYPPGDIVQEVLSGRAVVHPPLGDTSLVPFFVDSLRYGLTAPAGTYAYVVVAQQFGPNIRQDWRAVGQYDLDADPSVPTPVTLADGDTTRGINILVDFLNPPPTPFR